MGPYGATRFARAGIEARRSRGHGTLPAYRDGRFLVQDEAAQLVTLMLAPRKGEAVLDACAAPGGKTGQLRGEVTAVESDPGRASELRANLATVGRGDVTVVEADAIALPPELAGFDRALVDAPCSGLGVLRRRADARWRKEEAAIGTLAALQRSLLPAAAALELGAADPPETPPAAGPSPAWARRRPPRRGLRRVRAAAIARPARLRPERDRLPRLRVGERSGDRPQPPGPRRATRALTTAHPRRAGGGRRT